MFKIKESNFAKAQFIIFGMISIIISLVIPEYVTIEAFSSTPFSLLIWINIFNAIGSILIVGGIFEVIFKDQFIKEVSKDFIKALFLDKSSLGHFNSEDLSHMQNNIQAELLGLENRHFKSKFMKMINNSFFKIAQGTHENANFNMYYDYYNVVIYIKKSEDKYVEIEYDLKYKLKNNKVNDAMHLVESENNVFAKRFFPPFSKDVETQGLVSLSIKSDGKEDNFTDDILDNNFKEMTISKSNEDDVRAIQEDIKKQIQRKNEDGSFSPFIIKFQDYLIVEKKIWVKTLYTDLNYSHIFKRPTLNYSIHFIDENVDIELKDIDYLSLRLFSGLNKKNNDKIHPVLKGNSISLTVSNELLLAGEGVSINSIRKDWHVERD